MSYQTGAIKMDMSMMKHYNKFDVSNLSSTSIVRRGSKTKKDLTLHSLKYDRSSFAKIQTKIEILKMEGNLPSDVNEVKMTIMVLNKLRSYSFYPILSLACLEIFKRGPIPFKTNDEISIPILLNSISKGHFLVVTVLMHAKDISEEDVLSTKCKFCDMNVIMSFRIFEKQADDLTLKTIDEMCRLMEENTCLSCNSI